MEIFSTQTLITIAMVLAIYAIMQKAATSKKIEERKLRDEYLSIIHSEDHKVK